MSELGGAIARERTAQPDPEPEAGSEPGIAPDAGPSAGERRKVNLLKTAGLLTAPVLIAVLAGVLWLYYQSLDLANANRQQRSALDWSTKLRPQTLEVINIAFLSTALVIVIAVPLGDRAHPAVGPTDRTADPRGRQRRSGTARLRAARRLPRHHAAPGRAP